MTLSPSASYCEDITRPFDRMHIQPNEKDMAPMTPRECLIELIQQVDQGNLRQVLNIEMNRLMTDHERLVTMLQQRTLVLEQENESLRARGEEYQRRYEKAVREMQFFKKKYDHAMSNTTPETRRRSLSVDSELIPSSLISGSSDEQNQHIAMAPAASSPATYPLTPTSPQPSSTLGSSIRESTYSLDSQGKPRSQGIGMHSASPSITSIASSHHQQQQQQQQQQQLHQSVPVNYGPTPSASSASYWNNAPLPSVPSGSSTSSAATISASSSLPPPAPTPVSSVSTDMPRIRGHRHAGTNSIYSVSTESSYTPSLHTLSENGASKHGSASSWQYLRHNPSMHSSYSTPSSSLSSASHPSQPSNSAYSVPMTPVRSSTSTNGYTGSNLIQQRRVDPLLFGGSDGLWDTIAKSKGSDATVEKIISNFLRRGGSPNTAKQSASAGAVKSGYGMVHALIVTKAPGALDLLLQQGGNPNAFTLSQPDEDKVTPCYLAAKVGWLAGLQKLVQAGGDLVRARGHGSLNKTALHVAAEYCHAAVAEFIVGYTEGALNAVLDSQGATVLHYASMSGHTDLVTFFSRSCQVPVTQADARGELPIHWAARHGRLEVVTLLIERFGCDPNAYVHKKVGTPVDLAKSAGHKRVVEYLKGMGGLSAKKMDKKRGEEVPTHLTSTLARNGLFGSDSDSFF